MELWNYGTMTRDAHLSHGEQGPVLEHIIEAYGYAALLVGTFLEGETIMIIGGFAAHWGYLYLPLVILAGFLGTLAGDQLYFFIGRRKGQAFLSKRPSWQPHVEKVNGLLTKHGTWLILGFRFIYGIRTVTPFVIGMSRVKTGTFAALNIVGALAWAIVIGTGGYLFGAALEVLIADIKYYEVEAMILVSVTGIIFWLIHFYRKSR
ncbi:MAG: DedA family protein [Nitrospiraceae bacterium]|nr:MAG: DedA family protein [Nitrospiraceae bacterium]